MSSPRRFKGATGGTCCGKEYWASPYIENATLGTKSLAGAMTEAETDAIFLIEGGVLWSVDRNGFRVLPTPGLPHPAYDAALAREEAAIAVIEAQRGELNYVRDTWPMPPEWYRTNGTLLNTTARRQHAVEIQTKYPGWMAHQGVTLWCAPCTSAGEDLLAGLQFTLGELAPLIRGVAMIASYVPVLGTAVSYVMNATLSLAEGENVDEALLDAAGKALPGQPMSGMAFEAARAIANGREALDVALRSVLSQLPGGAEVKEGLAAVVSVFKRVADGQPIERAFLDEVYARLPPEGQKAMAIASRLVAGESVLDIAEAEATEAVKAAAEEAMRRGPEAARRFVAEAGYQGGLAAMPLAVKEAVAMGLAAGETERQAFLRFDDSEKNVAGNDAWAAKGRAIVDGGAKWRGMPLRDNLKMGYPFTWTRTERDAVSGTLMTRTDVYTVTDAWRRGFDVAMGLFEGSGGAATTDAQRQVAASLGSQDAMHGFWVGQFVQSERAMGEGYRTPTQAALAMMLVANPKLAYDKPALSASTIAAVMSVASTPRLSAVAALPKPTAADPRLTERRRWVSHYLAMT